MFSFVASGMSPMLFAFGLIVGPPNLNDPLYCPIDPRPHPAPIAAEQAKPIENGPTVTPPTPSAPKLLVISRGSTMLLQMTSKRPIVRVETDREDVIRVVPENPTTLRVTALTTGVVRLKLYDDKGNVETKQMGR
jgi:hypothetical protein